MNKVATCAATACAENGVRDEACSKCLKKNVGNYVGHGPNIKLHSAICTTLQKRISTLQ